MITITDKAAREISSIIKYRDLDPSKARLHVGAKWGGEFSPTYILDVTDEEDANVKPFETKHIALDGTTFFLKTACDEGSRSHLEGLKIDFRQVQQSGGWGFTFDKS